MKNAIKIVRLKSTDYLLDKDLLSLDFLIYKIIKITANKIAKTCETLNVPIYNESVRNPSIIALAQPYSIIYK